VRKVLDGWFKFTNAELAKIAILIAVGSVFSTAWSWVCYTAKVLGPFSNLFAAYGFNIVTFLIIYFVPKSGAATLAKTVGGLAEVLMGNPVGMVAVFYGFAEGLAGDIAFAISKGKIDFNMIVIASLLAWLITAPVDAYRDAVPLTVVGLATYFGPGMMGKVWTSWLCDLTIKLLEKHKRKDAG
jgi:hypothetical protein